MRDEVVLRLATWKDGRRIGELVAGDEWEGLECLRWKDVSGLWLVAENTTGVIGCVMPVPTKPIGHVEHMGLDSSLNGVQRGRVVSRLMNQAFAMLRNAGCGAAMTTIPDGLDSYVQVLERRGGKVIDHANVMIKRLV